jgi:hypothetical protein
LLSNSGGGGIGGRAHPLLERAECSITRAAAMAEVSRQLVQKRMRKYGLPSRTK